MDTIDDALSLVLAPVSQQDFLDRHWEQAPLHISRNSTEHFNNLLSVQHIENLLSSQVLHYPSVQLTRSDEPVPISHYIDDANRISALALIEHHHAGATIVISQAHEKLAKLADFRRGFQRAFHLRCQTNIYLSPPGKQGFNAHYDSHDVFILQVHGTKSFNIYGGGVVLPYNHESFDRDVHVAGELQESILLQPGDTLYIPRGVMHDAVANDETSLHITLGVYAQTLRDVLMESVRLLSDQDVSFRSSVPVSSRSADEQGAAMLGEKLLNLMQEGALEGHVSEALAILDDQVTLDSNPDCTGLLVASSVHRSVSLTSTVRVKQSNVISLQRIDSMVRCRAVAVVLEFQDPLGAGIEQLFSATTLKVADLEGMVADQQLALCERLRHANLLEII